MQHGHCMNAPTILIAEDEEIDVILLKRAFLAAGVQHPIQVTRDGREALDYLESLQTHDVDTPWPVLFLLDINMPRCNGLEVLERLRDSSFNRAIPIIVFSSSNHPRDVEQAYRLGANAYLVKPTSTTQRNEMIRVIHAFWLKLNQVPMLGVAG
jgi:two-component system response regulator